MQQKPVVCTISKFPPYMSGHSFEAMNQGRGLFELTNSKHFEVTYEPSLYDKSVNFNDSPELIKYSKKYLNVSYVDYSKVINNKVVEGELTKAFLGEIIYLLEKKDVNVLSTFYIDPHAYIANLAKDYAKRILGRKVITAHKAVGSDVLNSIGNHINNGQGKFLLNEFLSGDLVFAVSEFTAKKINEYAKKLLPVRKADELANKLRVLYPPFQNEYFEQRDEAQIMMLKKSYKIPEGYKIISYFGRLFPEKGIDDLLLAYADIKRVYPKTFLIIGGYGIEMNRLKIKAKELGISDYKFAGAVADHDKRAIMQMSYLGVIPTKPIDNFVETLCISALEYQASGCVLLTTKVGGVPEAGGLHSLYGKHSSPEDLFKKISMVLEGKINREEIIAQGLKHVAKFNYKKITSRFLDLVNQKLNS